MASGPTPIDPPEPGRPVTNDTAPATGTYLDHDGAPRLVIAGDPIPPGWAPAPNPPAVAVVKKARRAGQDKARKPAEDK